MITRPPTTEITPTHMRFTNLNEMTITEKTLLSNMASLKGDSPIHHMIEACVTRGDNERFYSTVDTLIDMAAANEQMISKLLGENGYRLLRDVHQKSKARVC
jgi:hypothetical protein